eukprot:COSAG04_NODE_20203_length_398_cov_1.020067_1_plen_116_part_10
MTHPASSILLQCSISVSRIAAISLKAFDRFRTPSSSSSISLRIFFLRSHAYISSQQRGQGLTEQGRAEGKKTRQRGIWDIRATKQASAPASRRQQSTSLKDAQQASKHKRILCASS